RVVAGEAQDVADAERELARGARQQEAGLAEGGAVALEQRLEIGRTGLHGADVEEYHRASAPGPPLHADASALGSGSPCSSQRSSRRAPNPVAPAVHS